MFADNGLRQMPPLFIKFGARRASCSSNHVKEQHPMSQSARNTTNDDLPREVIELAEAIVALPQEYRNMVEPLVNRVIDSNRRRRRILSLVQDALSQLRLDMKYLAFDLEATRRERDELRRKYEETA
jgi:hypothetical protein